MSGSAIDVRGLSWRSLAPLVAILLSAGPVVLLILLLRLRKEPCPGPPGCSEAAFAILLVVSAAGVLYSMMLWKRLPTILHKAAVAVAVALALAFMAFMALISQLR